jgi:TolB-like protein/DNA-binding SARP family transcriptional activator/tetratricopeptide (TPR) repeat protein
MIRFRMLGGLSLTAADGREVRSLLAQPRRLALLAYLAAGTPRDFQRRDSLVALFWPEVDQKHARAALREALHVLRGAVGQGIVTRRGDEEIGLDFGLFWNDVAAFDRAVAAAEWGEALELYRGDLLEGFFISEAPEFERWLETDRARLKDAACRSAHALIERSEASGDFAAAASWARRAAGLTPFDEKLVRHWISLLDRLGDRARAVQVYDEFASRLAQEYEMQPATESQALIAAVRSREAAPSLRAPAAPPSPAPPTSLTGLSPPTRRRPSVWWSAPVVAALATILLLANPGDWEGRTRRGARIAGIRSLAVRPLADLSRDTLHSWFADGMTEAMITDLGRISALRVTSLQLKDTASFRNIVRELHVDAVVEGGVQRSGDRVRVDVRLIDALSGYQLWADRFEASDRDRFALEDRVRRGIMAALKVPVTASEQRSLDTPPTSAPEAYDLYLRGRLGVRKVTPAHLTSAIALLEKAVALDPGFAAAYAELAHAYGQRVFALTPNDTASWERALVAGEKALRLRPDLAEAHYARAYLLWGPAYRFPHVLAIQEYRRALALNPSLEDAHHQLGVIYNHIGFLDDAIAEFQRALVLDPTDLLAEERIGVALVHQGKYQDALRVLRQIPPDKNPALWHYHVAWALLHLGKDSDASALIERYLREHPEDRGGLLTSARAFLRAERGDVRGAAEDIRRAEAMGAGYIHFHHSASRIASAYAVLRRPGPAVQWLRRAADDGLPCYPCFATDPDLDRIRNDPGFVAFMKELKAQWEQYRAALREPAASTP